MHPNLIEIIKQCRDTVPKSCIMIGTNGDYVKSSNDLKNLQNKNRNMKLCDVCSFRGGAYKHLLEKV